MKKGMKTGQDTQQQLHIHQGKVWRKIEQVLLILMHPETKAETCSGPPKCTAKHRN